jgi:hypothetical protein
MISNNSYSGKGSDFLRDFDNIPEVISGKLHIKAKIKGEKSKAGSSKKQSNGGAKLDDFFAQLDKGQEKTKSNTGSDAGGDTVKPPEPKTVAKKKDMKSSFGFYGKYPMYQL